MKFLLLRVDFEKGGKTQQRGKIIWNLNWCCARGFQLSQPTKLVFSLFFKWDASTSYMYMVLKYLRCENLFISKHEYFLTLSFFNSQRSIWFLLLSPLFFKRTNTFFISLHWGSHLVSYSYEIRVWFRVAKKEWWNFEKNCV